MLMPLSIGTSEMGALIAADDFVDEIDKALGLLSQFPKLGETNSHNTRAQPLQSFSYSLIYRLQNDSIRCPSQPPTRVLG